jgi:hypothetical protein
VLILAAVTASASRVFGRLSTDRSARQPAAAEA